MKRNKYFKKLFLCAIVILIMAFVSPTSVKAQAQEGTLYFTYNSERQTLTIEKKPISLNFCILFEDNVFASTLKQIVDEDKDNNIEATIIDDDKAFLLFPQNNLWPIVITNVNASQFDSALCMKLTICKHLGSGEIDPNTRYTVIVRPDPSPRQADTSDNRNTNASSIGAEEGNGDFHMGLILIIVAVVAIASVAIWWLVRLHNNKTRKSPQPMKSKDASVEVMEVVEETLANGLDAVRENVKDYYLMDMQQDFADTAVHKIYLHHTAVKKMYDFFKTALESSDQTTETGCYFVGCWEYATDDKKTYNISVEDIVEPGDDIVSGEFSFNFGLKIGVKLFSKISELTKRTQRDFVHTVWMHSHPGLGLFLSSHDLLVQQQLTYSEAPKRLVAFVIDTNTPDWDLAVFTSKNDGTMNNKDELRRLYSLETLYKWSRQAHASAGNNHDAVNTVAEEQKNKEDYYPLQVNNQGNTKTSNAFFSGKAINAIDDILYNCAGKATIGGYVEGTCDNHGTIWIENCTTEPIQDALGIIVVDTNVTDQSIASEYVTDQPVLCVLVCRSDDELLVLTRNNTQEPFTPLADSKANPMTQIKEWLRRRRIYK